MHQSEFRVPVAQILNLFRATVEAMVALAEVTLLVLPFAVCDTAQG
jgi:hypothetical protein